MIRVLGQYPDKTLNGAIAGIRDKLKNDPKSSSDTDADGFKALMDCDQYSTRQFLAVLVFPRLLLAGNMCTDLH